MNRRYGGSGPHHIGAVVPSVMAQLRPPETRAERYVRATRFVLARIVPLYRAAGLTITDVGIATVVGQLLGLTSTPPKQ